MLNASLVSLKNVTPQDMQNEEQVNVKFRGAITNALERNPQADSFEKKKGASKKTKAIAATVAAVGLCVIGALAFKGKLKFGQKNMIWLSLLVQINLYHCFYMSLL